MSDPNEPPMASNWDDDSDDRPRPRRRRRDDYDDGYDEPRSESNSMALVGLILGVVSLCAGCLAGVPAIICSAIGMKKPAGKKMAVTGLVLGLIGTFVTVPILIWLMMQSVERVREAAARTRDQHNLKQIGLAAHMYHNVKGHFPPATDPVSLRVHLLPYLEQESLHRQFDVTQPWDSPRNQSASNAQVQTYQTPFDTNPGTNTPYRGFVGVGTMFEPDPKRKVTRTDVTDGTDRTILLVHAQEQVPWAAPQELRYSPDAPLPAFGHPGLRGGTNVLMADGSVRFMRNTTPEQLVRGSIVRNDGVGGLE